MSEYAVQTRSTTPANVFAGDFPTITDTGTAGAAIEAYMPVMQNEDGEIVPVTKEKAADVVGIAAAAADKDEPVVYFLTGEFFANGLSYPSGVAAEDVKAALRKLSIFLK